MIDACQQCVINQWFCVGMLSIDAPRAEMVAKLDSNCGVVLLGALLPQKVKSSPLESG